MKICFPIVSRRKTISNLRKLDPNYMGSFDGNSPLNFCDGCTHLIVNCCCPKTNKYAEWYSFIHEWYYIFINRNTKYIFWQCFKICSNLIIKKILSRIFYKSLEHFCSKKSKYWFYKIQNLGIIYTKFWVYLIWYYLTNHILYHQHNVQWYTFSSVYTVSTFAKFRLRGIFG